MVSRFLSEAIKENQLGIRMNISKRFPKKSRFLQWTF